MDVSTLTWPAETRFPTRQVHLDFHTSPFIPGVASEFDPEDFARTMEDARVDSVTVFARCHHGMCYYPSKVATVHPHLGGRDLLGEMIEALHRRGIRCPVYTTVAWDEDVARRHPEWRMMHQDGTFARSSNADPTRKAHPGGWHYNDFTHPEYQDFLEAHTRELCERYDVDGIFYDIVFYPPNAHHSAASLDFRRKRGFQANDCDTFQRFQSAAQAEFASKFARILRGLSPAASVFFNSNFDLYIDGIGGRARAANCSHVEIESLPSGFWGYFHFPRLARGAGRWSKPWLGMTGRFQKMWGDFGGIKPQPALEFECFRSQALGGANSIGDQLPPRGKLDAAAYKLIGAVYTQCEEAEPFYSESVPVEQVGVLTANHADANPDSSGRSDEGVIQMLEESHYDATLLDEHEDLQRFSLLILPDETVVSPRLAERLKAFYEAGGKLILSHKAGRDRNGVFALDFLKLSFTPESDLFPTYWRTRPEFCASLSQSDRVVYNQGSNIVPGESQQVLVDRVLPYFRRTDLTFSSHFQTPPVKEPCANPAVIAGDRWVYFADPIFREYREVGNIAVRDVWRLCMERLIGPPAFGHQLPTTILVYPRRRANDLLLTLLHYVPLRKSLELDVLEERMSFADERLLVRGASSAVLFPSGEALPKDAAGAFILPSRKGRLLVTLPGYFNS
ncbi:MAG: alpha-amylase family protein [Opitutaceae bacterium]|nr:alpha-amylase family protein [Opitutaceae bacterium]